MVTESPLIATWHDLVLSISFPFGVNMKQLNPVTTALGVVLHVSVAVAVNEIGASGGTIDAGVLH